MSITVQWLLEQNQLEGFSLIAGDTSSGVEISGVNVMDNPEILPWLTKGALILSTGYFYTDPKITGKLIETLAKKGSSGLGIKMNRFIHELPKEMIEQAREYHFPIFSIPMTLSLDQVSNLIYHKLYENEMADIYSSSMLYHDVAECVLNNQKLSKILPLISKAVQGSVFLTNENFDIIEYSLVPDFPYPFPFSFCMNENILFSESTQRKIISEINEQDTPMIEHTEKYADSSLHFCIYPLINKKKVLGYISILNEPDDKPSYRTIMNIRSILCIILMNHSMMTESERSGQDIFYHNLLSGRLKNTREIESLCLQNGFDFKKSRLCFSIHIPEYESYTLAKRRAYERKIYSYIDDVFQDTDYCVLKTVFQTRFIIFCLFNDSPKQKDASIAGFNLSKALSDTFIKNGIASYIGYSQPAHDSSTIISCYHQADEAVNIGKNIHPDSNIYSYYDDAIYHIIINHFTNQELLEIYDETLGVLEKYDEKTQSELLLTLRTYLKCDKNISQSAKELFIHRNTMFYRLEQIKEQLSVDFDSADDIFRIQMGFYVRDIIKASNPSPALR